MDWPNERFVKVYIRDSANWLALSWSAQALFLQLLRKVNYRTGLLDLGKLGAKAVAVLLQQVAIWESVIEPALHELLAEGLVTVDESGALAIPNFIEAQTARQSAKLRQANYKAKLKAERDNGPQTPGNRGGSQNVTQGVISQEVTHESQNVSPETTNSIPEEYTGRHGVTRGDDLDKRRLEKIRDQISPTALTQLPGSTNETGGEVLQLPLLAAPKKPSAGYEATAWVAWFNSRFNRRFQVGRELVADVSKLIRAGYSQRDMRAVARYMAERWQGDEKMADYLRPSTLLRLSNFKRYVVDAREFFAELEASNAL